MAVVAVFGLLFLERFHLALERFCLLSQLLDGLQGCLERLFDGGMFLLKPVHLNILDGESLLQQQLLVSQVFKLPISVHVPILPDRFRIAPGSSPSG